MRIISGDFRGKKLSSVKGDKTRPTADKVKESIFNSIQTFQPFYSVLDLFAGTGNLGIESFSRWKSNVYFVDNQKRAIEVIKKNTSDLKFDSSNGKILLNDYKKSLIYFKNNSIKFDLVFLDPPYKDKIIIDILVDLIKFNLLEENSLVIVEVSDKNLDQYEAIKNNVNFEFIKEKKYSTETLVLILEYIK